MGCFFLLGNTWYILGIRVTDFLYIPSLYILLTLGMRFPHGQGGLFMA